MKTCKIATLALLLFINTFNFVFAQQSAFEEVLDEYYPLNKNLLSFCSETSDGHYLVVLGKCMVLKLDMEGNVVDELDYELKGANGRQRETYISGLIDIPGDPSHHLAIAEAYDSDTGINNVFHIIKFDDYLEYDLDDVTVVDLSEEVCNFWAIRRPRFLLDPDGSLCLAANAVRWDGTNALMFVRVDVNGGKIVVFDDGISDPNFVVYDFALVNDNYSIVIDFNEEHPYLYYCIVSREFELDMTYCLTDGTSSQTPLKYDNHLDSLIFAISEPNFFATPKRISDSLFLLPTNVLGVMGASIQHGAGLWKLDNDFNIIGHAFFDVFNGQEKREITYSGNPVLVKDDDVYFCYTTFKGSFSQPMQTVVCKLDTNLNLKWRRWYGGENEKHLITDGTFTSDGGCLFTGVTSNMSDPYPYILKITADGYCSVKEDDEPLLKPFNCYPNPVDDILQVEYSPDVTPKAVELYDLQGRLVHTQHNNLENIGMENLPAGNYTLRVLLDDGKNYTEKVVKQ